MTNIGGLHQYAYDRGIDPIDNAVQHVAVFLETCVDIRASRAIDPATYPGYGTDISFDHFARRIVGELLDAGWTPPRLGRGGDNGEAK